MKQLISPQAMRESERQYFLISGVRSIDVMERAAQALADCVRKNLAPGASVYFACGVGGNGGDGSACARLLAGDYRCQILQLGAPVSPDAAENLRRAREHGIPVHWIEHELPPLLPVPDGWVDALFGTGLSRAPSGVAGILIRRINADGRRGARIFAADIPSGLNGSTGAAFDPCVRADATVTFQYLKTGLCLADGLDVCGAVTLADVGFPRTGFGPMDGWLLESADLPGLLPTRPRNLHKGRCGHLLIVAGALGMAGAAVMCARGALRSGAGLVSIACPLSIVPVLQALVPQAMCIPLPEQEGVVAPEAAPVLRHALSGKTAAVVGCGLSRRAAPEAVLSVLESGLPAVIDADGLNLLSESPALLAALRPHHILTPHPGEAARLLTALPDGCQESASPLEIVRKLGKLGATVLYKGAACIAFSPEAIYFSASGCSGMAKGGSGDVLSGILGALLAEPSSRAPALTAALASELHGLSGERAQARYGNRSMNAMDIPEFLPEVFPS